MNAVNLQGTQDILKLTSSFLCGVTSVPPTGANLLTFRMAEYSPILQGLTSPAREAAVGCSFCLFPGGPWGPGSCGCVGVSPSLSSNGPTHLLLPLVPSSSSSFSPLRWVTCSPADQAASSPLVFQACPWMFSFCLFSQLLFSPGILCLSPCPGVEVSVAVQAKTPQTRKVLESGGVDPVPDDILVFITVSSV